MVSTLLPMTNGRTTPSLVSAMNRIRQGSPAVSSCVYKKYRNMGRKNVFHKNKYVDVRYRDGAVCLSNTSVPTWKKQLVEKHPKQGGVATTHVGQHSLVLKHFGYAFTIPTSGNILMHPLPMLVTTYNKLH